MEVRHVDTRGARDLSSEALDANGRLRVMPAAFYAGTTQAERSMLCVRHGLYILPTHELIERLRELIAGRRAIEIGAGNGVVAEALGIPATDSYQQDDPAIRKLYTAMQQAPVRYGANVERLDADAALKKYRPEVVLGCWVTHRYDASRPELEGNAWGIREHDIINAAQAYIVVGNTHVHGQKPIWRMPHQTEVHPYLYSRAGNGTPDFIAVWGR